MSAALRLLNGKNSVKGATGLLVVTLFLSNLLGLFRDRFLAAKIPAAHLDSYYAAFRLPDLLTNLIVVGAIAVVFIPVFTKLKSENEQKAWAAASAVLNIMVLLLASCAFLVWLFLPQLMPLIVPNFAPAKLVETIALARWLMVTPLLFGISYILSGILNSYQRFTVYSLAPLVYNLSIIVATVGFADQFGVRAVVIGVVIGAFLHMLIQLPIAFLLGWRWQPILTIQHPAVRTIGGMMIPRTVGLVGMQFVTIVATGIASHWPGAITYYSLATNIQTMPTAVFANSIATALFPAISLAAATNNHEDYHRQLEQGIRWILFLLVPATVGMILLRIQIVRLILGAGYFGWVATQTTADVLGWFALSIVAVGLVPLLARAFYAHQNVKTPMTLALIAAGITIALSYLLAAILPETISLGHTLLFTGQAAALAIAYSIGMIVNAGLLIIALRRELRVSFIAIGQSLTKIILATMVMGVLIEAMKILVGTTTDLHFARSVFLQTFGPIIVGGASYLGLAAWLGCVEWRELASLLRKKPSTPTSTVSA